jgi:hypothetical protein
LAFGKKQETNTMKDSHTPKERPPKVSKRKIARLDMAPLDFNRLWAAYPQQYHPCQTIDGTPHFENQCAIRFGIALIDGGVNVRSFRGVRCWHGHGFRHLLRGEEIAAWMKKNPSVFGQVRIYHSVDQSVFTGRRGLIFCRNFWGEGNQGDHIDLWNRTHMASGDPTYISRSAEVWFWELEANTLAAMVSKRSKKSA